MEEFQLLSGIQLFQLLYDCSPKVELFLLRCYIRMLKHEAFVTHGEQPGGIYWTDNVPIPLIQMFSYHLYRRGKQKQKIKKIKIKISLHFCLKCLAYVHLCDFCLFESIFQGGAQPFLTLANHVF